MTIREWREKLQAPRRPYDTWYGRHVMRFFSVYLTVFFSRLPFVTPSVVTLLSVAAGLAGAACWAVSRAWEGALLLNLWYLLDHVDGELARLKGKTSVTGLYFDTVANALVMPASLAALGVGLGRPWLGVAAAYGCLMLLVVTYCESVVVLQWQGTHRTPDAPSRAGSHAKSPFTWVHRAFSYPVFLPVATIAAVTDFLEPVLLVYAAGLNLVWSAVLVRTLSARKIETKYSFPAP